MRCIVTTTTSWGDLQALSHTKEFAVIPLASLCAHHDALWDVHGLIEHGLGCIYSKTPTFWHLSPFTHHHHLSLSLFSIHQLHATREKMRERKRKRKRGGSIKWGNKKEKMRPLGALGQKEEKRREGRSRSRETRAKVGKMSKRKVEEHREEKGKFKVRSRDKNPD